MVLTKEIYEQGKSSNGGYNYQQLQAVGVDTKNFTRGWAKKLVGSEQTEEAIQKFLSLKDLHFKPEQAEYYRTKRKGLSFEYITEPLTFQQQYTHPNWQKMRLHCLKRDNFQCVNCGNKQKTLHAHHLKYIKGKYVWDVPPFYIVTLCEDCHSEEHGRDLTIKH